jgi:2-oxoglutarate ferredoxin oxidoreductase subunit delta
VAKISVNPEKCKSCELCLDVCPHHLVVMSKTLNSKGGYFASQINEEKCTGCKLCAIMCPFSAISVYK